MNLQREVGKSFSMGQRKKMRSTEFLQHQADAEIVERVAAGVEKIKENLMQDYLDRKKKREKKE